MKCECVATRQATDDNRTFFYRKSIRENEHSFAHEKLLEPIEVLFVENNILSDFQL